MTIKAGDLVMVVRPTPCCGNASKVGRVGVVAEVKTVRECVCSVCNRPPITDVMACVDGYWYRVSRLIRIDPPAGPVSVFDRVEEPA